MLFKPSLLILLATLAPAIAIELSPRIWMSKLIDPREVLPRAGVCGPGYGLCKVDADGTAHCAQDGGLCCSDPNTHQLDGTSCLPGQYCTAEGCCPNGEVCEGGGGVATSWLPGQSPTGGPQPPTTTPAEQPTSVGTSSASSTGAPPTSAPDNNTGNDTPSTPPAAASSSKNCKPKYRRSRI